MADTTGGMTVGTLRAILGLDSRGFNEGLALARTQAAAFSANLKALEQEADRLKIALANAPRGSAEYTKLQGELALVQGEMKTVSVATLAAERQMAAFDHVPLTDLKAQLLQVRELAGQVGAEMGMTGGLAGKVGGAPAGGFGTAGIIGGIAVGAAAAGYGLFEMAEKTAHAAEEMHNLSVATGVSSDRLQEYQHVANVTGLGFERMTNGIVILERNLRGIEGGTGNAAKVAEELGISVKGANGEFRSMDEIFPEIVSKLQGMTNPTERNSAALALFGRSAKELLPFLALSREEMSKFIKEAHDMGLVLPVDEMKKQAEAINKLHEALRGMEGQIAKQVLPTLQRLADDGSIERFAKAAGSAIAWFGEQIRTSELALEGLKEINAEVGLALVRTAEAQEQASRLHFRNALQIMSGLPGEVAAMHNANASRLAAELSKKGGKSGGSGEEGGAGGPSEGTDEQKKAEDELWSLRLKHADDVTKIEMERNKKLSELTNADAKTRKAIWLEYQKDIDEIKAKHAEEEQKKQEEAAEKLRQVQMRELEAYASVESSKLEHDGRHFEARETLARAAYSKETSDLEQLAKKGEDTSWRQLAAYQKYADEVEKLTEEMRQKQRQAADNIADAEMDSNVIRLKLARDAYGAERAEIEVTAEKARRHIAEELADKKISTEEAIALDRRRLDQESLSIQQLEDKTIKSEMDKLVQKYAIQAQAEDQLADIRKNRELDAIRMIDGEFAARVRALDYEAVEEHNRAAESIKDAQMLADAKMAIDEDVNIKRMGLFQDEEKRLTQQLRNRIQISNPEQLYQQNVVASFRAMFGGTDTETVQRDSLTELRSIRTEINRLARATEQMQQSRRNASLPTGSNY